MLRTTATLAALLTLGATTAHASDLPLSGGQKVEPATPDYGYPKQTSKSFGTSMAGANYTFTTGVSGKYGTANLGGDEVRADATGLIRARLAGHTVIALAFDATASAESTLWKSARYTAFVNGKQVAAPAQSSTSSAAAPSSAEWYLGGNSTIGDFFGSWFVLLDFKRSFTVGWDGVIEAVPNRATIDGRIWADLEAKASGSGNDTTKTKGSQEPVKGGYELDVVFEPRVEVKRVLLGGTRFVWSMGADLCTSPLQSKVTVGTHAFIDVNAPAHCPGQLWDLSGSQTFPSGGLTTKTTP